MVDAMTDNRLKRFFADLQNLAPLSGLEVHVRREEDFLLILDDNRIWCLIREEGTDWELCFNRFCGEADRRSLMRALRKVAPGERILFGEDCVFVSLEPMNDD